MGDVYSTYKKQSVTTMTPMEIVIKLYSETERQLNRAVYFIDEKDYENANKALSKGTDLIDALRSVLDMELPIGRDLDALYDYFGRQIITANMKKDKTIIENILPMIAELKNSFVQINAMPKSEIAAQAAHNGK